MTAIEILITAVFIVGLFAGTSILFWLLFDKN